MDNGKLEKYFKNAKYDFVRNKISPQYYEDEKINQILECYIKKNSDSSFLIPIGALNCINNLIKLTKDTTMFLISDKGISDYRLFDERVDPDISFHGSVSMMVNFDAINRYTNLSSGQTLMMGNKGADFQVANYIYNLSNPTAQTKHAFNQSLATFSPQDLFDICYLNDKPNKKIKSLSKLINILNLAQWDPNIFYDYHEILLNIIEKNGISIDLKMSLINGIEQAWNYFFKLEKNQDLPFALGSILYQLEDYDKALYFFKSSLFHYGNDKNTYYNLTLCYHALKQYDEAKEAANIISKL